MSYAHPEPLTSTADRLTGRVVLITGASSGIGAAAAKLFAAEGAAVVAVARRYERVEELVNKLRAAGHEALALACDVTDEASVAGAVEQAVRTFGKLDGAFNNAGLGGGQRSLHELDVELFDAVIATNLRGAFLCMKHEIIAMLAAGGGSIVNTSSVGGIVGFPWNSDYAASKFGLEGLIRCAALAYARQGIRVNAIAPGPTRSEMFDSWMPTEHDRTTMAGQFPMNYIAEPDDMARAALFLLSEESRWTTGTILPCEGGIAAG